MAVLSIIFSLNGSKQWALRGRNLTVIRVERYIEIELDVIASFQFVTHKHESGVRFLMSCSQNAEDSSCKVNIMEWDPELK